MSTGQQARKQPIELWKNRWTSECQRKWTPKIIKEVLVQQETRRGEELHNTDALRSLGISENTSTTWDKQKVSCIYGDELPHDANHIFFKSHQWREARRALENKLGELNTENFVEKMKTGDETRQQIASYVEYVLCTKNGTRTMEIFRPRRVRSNRRRVKQLDAGCKIVGIPGRRENRNLAVQ